MNPSLSNSRLSVLAVGRRLAIYAFVAAAGTALFIWLHHLGNQIPYELAQQRFAKAVAEVAQKDGAERYFQGQRPLLAMEFCELSVGVLAGARPDAHSNPLLDAVLPRSFIRKFSHCSSLQSAIEGQELEQLERGSMKSHYWWGNKALAAVALRHLSVWELHQFILFATYGAYLLLAAAMALLGWRALLVASPVIIFGMTLSGIPRFADLVNGPPTLWTVIAVSVLALLLRWPKTARLAPLFCFGTGMVSDFLYQSDGHNSLAIVLIGLVAWLGYERTNMSGATQRALRCTLLYISGFFICLALGQVAKYAVLQWQLGTGGYIFARVLEGLSYRLDQTVVETLGPLTQGEAAWVQACNGCGEEWWEKLPIVRDFRGFALLTPLGQGTYTMLNAFSALALTGAVGGAVWQAQRSGRRKLVKDVRWLIALVLLASTQFFLPNDIGLRNERFVFLLLAICWSCLAVAALQLNRKLFSVLAGCLALGMLISVTAFPHLAQFLERRGLAQAHLVGRADFDLYDDHDQLIYYKDDCGQADIGPRFFLHIFPVDRADLPEHRQSHSFDNLDFDFNRYGGRIGGGCVAKRSLPDYEIARVATGQFIPETGQIWRIEFKPRSK